MTAPTLTSATEFSATARVSVAPGNTGALLGIAAPIVAVSALVRSSSVPSSSVKLTFTLTLLPSSAAASV